MGIELDGKIIREFPTPRTVDNFIMRLRRVLEQDPEDPKLIASVRGVGYKLVH